jgi:hypothetical protein
MFLLRRALMQRRDAPTATPAPHSTIGLAGPPALTSSQAPREQQQMLSRGLPPAAAQAAPPLCSSWLLPQEAVDATAVTSAKEQMAQLRSELNDMNARLRYACA